MPRRAGFPHSEIHGSKLVRSSPWLIAAYHVLHRLLPPRHPPNALRSLDCSHYQCSVRPCCSRHEDASATKRTNIETENVRPDCLEINPTAVRSPPANLAATQKKDARYRPPVLEASGKSPLHDVNELIKMRGGCFQMSTRQSMLVDPTFSGTTSCLQNLSPNLSTFAGSRRLSSPKVVEPDGIEPTTSCLQSRRSPN